MKKEKQLYSPRLRNQRIRQLYKEAHEAGIPMTKLLDSILESHYAKMPKIRSIPSPGVDAPQKDTLNLNAETGSRGDTV